MRIVLATTNSGKVREIRRVYGEFEIYSLDEVLEPFEIVENGSSFQQNALIKARAVWDKLASGDGDSDFVVLSDDSGISVPVLNNEPGIFSARYSGENATDASNRAKLIARLKEKNLNQTPAFYTAAIAIKSAFGEYTTHGFMHGCVIDEERGDNGFGYDFMFIPNGFKNTIGQMATEIKIDLSHRTKALKLAKYILDLISQK